MFHAFNKGELRYYDIFHRDKDYAAEAKALPLKGKTVLEIGSGTGLMTKELRKLGYVVITVDPNSPADYRYIDEVKGWDRFDNILCLYDVWNYLLPNEKQSLNLMTVMNRLNLVTEAWDKTKGVRFFTHKKVDKYHRIRLGFKLFNKAHLLFIYWGKGLALAYHKLYL